MLKVLCSGIFLLFFICTQAYSIDFDYKKVSDFKKLSDFSSVEKFESELAKYVEDCLANTGGGTGGLRCYIGSNVWDRELNIYYQKLNSKLSQQEKTLLKKSQLTWLKNRDDTIEFVTEFLVNRYPRQGTMFRLMQAGDLDAVMTPFIKQRALFLKRWFEFESQAEPEPVKG
ncbi:lysozyme inhibitor LprI family protein [Spartinivicinus ruber]|uniref:lysozyme inhibitor LprI family protein n=1 Tax=Spartinivicinus ruber TaxID=2683272 RepID=UPI0013D2D3C7|nr:lysozyme inhibitor LprI family protein [Spartinivicinus ruber]